MVAQQPEPGSAPFLGWRCSLEEPRSGQRRGFASVLELAGYLLRAFGSRKVP